MATIDDLEEAAEALRKLTERRANQQRLVDDLISRARKEGHGWADLKRATGYYDRSLQLAIKRAGGA